MSTNVPASPPTPPKKGSLLGKIVKVLLLTIALLVIVFICVGLFVLDGKYEVSRETTIKAPPEAVHKQVGDLNEWKNWLPFIKQDPSVNVTIEKPTGVGARETWTSNNGNGELTVTASDEQKGIEFDMLFDKKWASKGVITYTKVGDETKVKWTMTGKNDDFLGKWMAAAMPGMVGPQFEIGLADLKAKVEGK